MAREFNTVNNKGRAGLGRGGKWKPKDFKNAIRQLSKYIKKQIPFLILVAGLAVFTAVVTVLVPKKIGEIAQIIKDSIAEADGFLTAGYSQIGKIGAVLAVLIVAGGICHYFQTFTMSYVVQSLGRRLRRDIDRKINRLPLSYFDSVPYGDVLARITSDVDTIVPNLSQSVTILVSAIALTIGLLIMMFITCWQLALVAVATVPLSLLVIYVSVFVSQKYFRRFQAGYGSLTGHVEEIYSGHEVVLAYSGQKQGKEKFDKIVTGMRNAASRSNFLSGLMYPVINFIGNLGLAAVCVAGGIMLTKNVSGVTFASIVAFVFYVKLFSNPLTQLAQVFTSLQSMAAASERVFEFLAVKEMDSESHKPKHVLQGVKGKVEFKDVTFGYVPEKKIIENFSAVAQPGQKIAIVGPTGAGKTTLVNLLMRFYEIDSGDILIDGVSVKDMTREEVHTLFCMVLQDSWLFDGTIKENIIYAKPGVTDDDVAKACADIGIDHIIKSLPNSYEMRVSEGANLSAGQKQLITIARAVVENAPMLILDEATSAVDTRTEILIQEAMDKLTEGRTSFIIAHRLSTIKNADIILVMENGGIAEQGNHAELMDKKGIYYKLYSSQFERV